MLTELTPEQATYIEDENAPSNRNDCRGRFRFRTLLFGEATFSANNDRAQQTKCGKNQREASGFRHYRR